jgi:molecular chaperone GrpE
MPDEERVDIPVPDEPAAAEETTRARDDLYDRLLRTTAEFDNYRKRTERERAERAQAAAADLLRELLPIVDDLERALTAIDDPSAGADAIAVYRDGVELIRRQLLDVLRRRGVETMDVVGQDFDPEWHEAVANEPADGRREGVIVEDVRRGYRLGGRLLRPAMVKVTKA